MRSRTEGVRPSRAGAWAAAASPAWEVPGRPTRAVVDLDAITANVGAARTLAAPAAVMAVVKANGYGHGATMVARAAVAAGAKHLAVATVDEGLALRRAGLRAPILVLGPVDPSEVATAIEAALSLTLVDPAFVDLVASRARASDQALPVQVHVKVDTGMRRFGAPPETAVAVARRVARTPGLSLAAVMTHFADADGPSPAFTAAQDAALRDCVALLAAEGIVPQTVHAANSAAIVRGRHPHAMVRLGIALYGLPAIEGEPLPVGMRPALGLVSRITRVIRLAPGDTVGYGRTYRSDRAELAALIPVGYADGYRRGLSGLGAMRVGGKVAPVLGRISMDQTVIALPAGTGATTGSEVLVAGGDEPPTSLAHLAKQLGTIPYEVAAGISARVLRVYLQGGRPTAIEDLAGLRLLVDEPGRPASDR